MGNEISASFLDQQRIVRRGKSRLNKPWLNKPWLSQPGFTPSWQPRLIKPSLFKPALSRRPELRPSVQQHPARLRHIISALKRGVKTETAPAKETRKLADTLVPAALCLIALTIFSYDVLLWQDGQARHIRLPEDTRVRADMLAFAGVSGGEEAAVSGAIPVDMVEFFAWKNYTVQRGDSVSKIAADHGLSMDAVIASNNMTNARALSAGEVIRLPNMDGIPYTVKNGDTLAKMSGSFGVPLEAILDANDIQDERIAVGTTLFIPGARMKSDELRMALGDLFVYPVKGRLTSSYGWRISPISGVRSFHAAIDLAAPMKTQVKAAMSGRVASVGYNAVYGRFMILSHANGFQTMYAHLNSTAVSEGATVRQGAKIGEVGTSGQSTGPHLHFSVYRNGRAVNPLEYLK
jgi:murein DD-endopeptidase MepM/ murein hydrolase activator NlpD